MRVWLAGRVYVLVSLGLRASKIWLTDKPRHSHADGDKMTQKRQSDATLAFIVISADIAMNLSCFGYMYVRMYVRMCMCVAACLGGLRPNPR